MGDEQSQRLTLEEVPEAIGQMESRIMSELQEIREALSSYGADDDRPMDVRECARYLSELEGKRISTGCVYNRIAAGTIPHYKKGSRLWFTRADIRATYTRKENFIPAIVDQNDEPYPVNQ